MQADFARQLAERNAKANTQKKFRSAAPKGSKLAAGFTDRTKERFDDDQDERAKRIKNLEEAMKLGQIDSHTFERLVQNITAGDITATYLVKGLDRKLLERVRNGEDVFAPAQSDGPGKDQEGQDGQDDDIEDEFEELAEKNLGPIVRERAEKKGELAPPTPVAGIKRTRADVLAELKRQRQDAAAAAAAEHEKKYPSLGKGFRKVNERGESTRMETDKQGRQVLIITDAQGNEKRKVRKPKLAESPPELRQDLDNGKKPINTHHLPDPKETEAVSEDEDIFQGVGSNFNPLADLDSDGHDSSDEEGKAAVDSSLLEPCQTTSSTHVPSDHDNNQLSTEPTVLDLPIKRNYFASSKSFTPADEKQTLESSAAYATVRAALQKVRTLDPSSSLINDADSEEARLKARLAKFAASDRDMEDMDMGFGGSRFDDAEEMDREGEKIKFSEWKGIGAGEDDGEEAGAKGGKRRKRGPKRKKGDKNSAADVLNAMERQKEKTLG